MVATIIALDFKKNYENKSNHNSFKKPFFKNYNPVTVLLTNLPEDISIPELQNLIDEWGNIKRINLKNVTAFILFNYKNEAKYFVEAIDKTPFDNLILTAKILD